MNKSFPVQIYPSQLQSFKEKTNELAEAIAESLAQKKLSAFKRNDYLSIALGYKSHDDLIDWANSRKQADKKQPLLLFVEEYVRESISAVFCKKVKALKPNTCGLILIALEQKEVGRKIISDIKENIERADTNMFLRKGSPTLKRLNRYLSAFSGIKTLAGTSWLGMTKKDLKVDPDEMEAAEKLISENKKEVNHIYQIPSQTNIPLMGLTETQLKDWLIDNDFFFSHLKQEPTYYAAWKKVRGIEYYFITQYFDDGDSWVGLSDVQSKAKEDMINSHEYKLIEVDQNEELTSFLDSLDFPELCSSVFVKSEPLVINAIEHYEPSIDNVFNMAFLDIKNRQKNVLHDLQRVAKINDIVILTGQPAIGKSLAVANFIPSKLIIDKVFADIKGESTNLTASDFSIAAQASKGVFAIDEGQIIPKQDLLTLTELAFENFATLIIVTQDIKNLPIASIGEIVSNNNGRISNLFIDKNGLPNEVIINGREKTT